MITGWLFFLTCALIGLKVTAPREPRLRDGRLIVEDDVMSSFDMPNTVAISRSFKPWNGRCWCGVEPSGTRIINGEVIDLCERHDW